MSLNSVSPSSANTHAQKSQPEDANPASPRPYRPDTLPAMAKSHPFIPFMVGVGLVGLFVSFPGVDIWVQSHFYNPQTGFAPKKDGFWGLLYVSVPKVAYSVLIGALSLLAWGEFRKQYAWGIDRQAVVYLLTTLALGPGLVVNVIFKNNWGRARPSQIVEFGGDATFTPAFVRATECLTNCSFVSGHASMGFYLVAVAFLYTGRSRTYWITTALIYGILVGTGRIAQGGHFFSDVLFSGLFTIAIAATCYHYIMHKDCFGKVWFMTPKWKRPDPS